VGAAVLAVAAVLAGCGGGDGDGEQAGTGGAAPTTAAAPACGQSAAPAVTVARATNDRLGAILVDGSGRTLYTFDRDTAGDGYDTFTASACTGACAQTWPPLLLPAGTPRPVPGPGVAGLSIFPRDDGGGNQVAVGGRPLYLYAGDTRPGDVNGDGVGGVWHVAKG
jgi:predicted lipoprotein with Yx(FWY)xxD motif